MRVQWTKESALAELRSLADLVDCLSAAPRLSAEHTRWVGRTLAFLEEVFGQNSRYYATFASLPWRETDSFIVDAWNPTDAVEQRHQGAYRGQLQMAKGVLLAAGDHLERTDIASVNQGKDSGPGIE